MLNWDWFGEKAKKLLKGSFNEIEPYTQIIHWRRIVRLYRALKETAKIEKEEIRF
jgi:hypothetical protein